MGTYGFSELTCTKVYPKYLEFRHQVFNEILKYNQTGNPVFDFKTFNVDAYDDTDLLSVKKAFDVEYDHYDVPKAIHLAYLQNDWLPNYARGNANRSKDKSDARVMGCLRFLPTDGSYMIKDNIERGVWKNVELLVDRLPEQPDIYEASRIAVDPQLSSDDQLREVILTNLVYANVELGVRLGVKKMIGIMYDRVWQSVYVKRGVPIRYISKPFTVDAGPPIIIGEIMTSEAVLQTLNQRYRDYIANRLLLPPEIEPATWLMHYYHVHKKLPLSRPMQMPVREMHALHN